jgi:hypothetical protein
MKKGELIKIIVPATIKCWKTTDGNKYNHDGKEIQLTKQYWGWTKKDLEARYNELERKGFIK